MYVLSLDTSSAMLSIAVLDEKKVLSYQEIMTERGQGEIVAGSLTKKNLLNKIIFSPEENTFSLERIILSGRN